MNQEFEALLKRQSNLADLIIHTQKEVHSLEQQEKLLSQQCGRSLAHFYLGLNDEHQELEQQLAVLQEELFQKRHQLVKLQAELEEKIDAIIEYYRKHKESLHRLEI